MGRVQIDRSAASSRGARVEDLGDLSVYGALNEFDARGRMVTPVFDQAARPGDRVILPAGRKIRTPIALGAPAVFWVLDPAPPGDATYRLDEILRVR